LIDKREFYSEASIEAFNQFSLHTRKTPTDLLDLRCEFDVPRFLDLKTINIKPAFTSREENKNFNWYQTEHDFNTPSSQKVE
jgi:hypothetical protein